ncbi:MAG: ribulose-phosphate 3-epimerase [Firmicutes bacterium]|nr:ribulose-phosphate 3-epimerase [Bacillota bacterium]
MRKVAPSLVAADLSCLARVITDLEAAGADRIHLDVEDGVFVPNLTFGFPILRTVRALTNLPVEVHLMVADPEPYLSRFSESGADVITVHLEALPYPRRVLAAIRKLGKSAHLALTPRTSVAEAECVVDLADGLLLMTSEPDEIGESFIPGSVERLRLARAMVPALEITVDGGITPAVVGELWAAGASTVVAGRAIFGAVDMVEAMRLLRVKT